MQVIAPKNWFNKKQNTDTSDKYLKKLDDFMNVIDYIETNDIKSPYLKYARNFYTQNGEDGVIEQLLSELEITSGICIDIGAWDGVFISNIYNLWRYKGFGPVSRSESN